MTDKDTILNSYLKRTFFKSWQKEVEDNYRSLEFVTTDRCSLSCKYCYFSRFGDQLFTEESRNEDNIFDGFKKMVEWLTRNRYHPQITFFSGEFFLQPINKKILYYFLDNIPPGIKYIVIPVGGTFLLHNDGEELIELQKKFMKKGVRLNYSLSIDGKYMDDNRPLKNKNLIRDDNFYNKVFKFAKDASSGFHPMVYSEGIENWPKNFLWFQEKFKEFELSWSNMYLLEVRNNNWSYEQIKKFGEFIEFLLLWLWDHYEHDKDRFFRALITKGNFNILINSLTTVGRGMGCGIQSTMHVRLGDLSIFPCHRLMKDYFKIGSFNVEDGKITDVKACNVELGILIKSTDRRSFPFCETCLIKELCTGQCLGSCHETHGDPFAPIPVVCKLELMKVLTIHSTIKKIGLYHDYLRLFSNKASSIISLEEKLCWSE
jgi:radical SAM protein with 4Fe4S-binding SPASM domain